MKNAILIFFICAFIGFGGGYLFSLSNSTNEMEKTVEETTNESVTDKQPIESNESDSNIAVSNENQIFNEKGCLACHAIENLNLQGGATGPDLSMAYVNVEGKHGKPINEFLKEPTSAVMSSVISGNPLTDDEITKIVDALKIASEK